MSSAETKGLPPLRGAQEAASDPAQHVWLSASAGTGKTQVLAARVFRLLLGGTDPSAILCLTFTKAGAAEMASRVNRRLAAWVQMDSIALGLDLKALGERATPELIERARTLFARVLDAPGGGLRIQTIHGFCQSLLAAFPVEAGLAPGFRPLEAREEAQLARETLSAMLVAARSAGRERVIDAVGALSLRLGEGEAERFLSACARAPEAMAALPGDVAAFVREALDVPTGDVMEGLARCCGDDSFDLIGLRRIAAANRAWGAAGGIEHAELAETWLAADPPTRVTMLGDLVSIAHTQKGEPRKISAKLIATDPDYEELARSLGDCCSELLAVLARAKYADLLAQGLEAGREYAAAYTAAKRRAGAVDFDDLIRTTVALFGQPGISEWVRYKLDQVTEHVLIDEAQDTNAAQWSIVSALADEFFVGRGLRSTGTRTLFTVGDHKQAIFGFQGTDPVFFQAAQRRFARKAEEAMGEPDAPPEERGLPFEELSLTHSFRSTKPILEFVDAAIQILPLPGLGLEHSETHASEVKGPGLVELWPPTMILDREGDDGAEEWVDDATRKVAGEIARQIKRWIDERLILRSGEAIRPEDVMVLVKRRGELASLIVARLYAEGVPVAGVDRLRLNAPLAVQDLLATVRFALQPDDDLSLASLLVSPLIGWTQDELMSAAPRKGISLWRHLRATQPAERLEPLSAMLARADFATPYRFFEEMLSGPLDGRRKLLHRLGAEARDPIEELLSAALAFETTGTPSLQLFLDWFDRGDVDIVRDPSQPIDAVRVMTAHGAKGLQAPVVILADACIDPGKSPRSILNWTPQGFDHPLPIIRPRSSERSGPIAEVVANVERRELEEHWRLFYVAATRAEERLVIAGALGGRSGGVPPANSWYAAADAAFRELGVEGEGVRAFTGTKPQPSPKAAPRKAAAGEIAPVIPAWVTRPAPPEARPPRPLAPSSIGDDGVADPPPSPAMRAAAERGRLLHALFERLPAVPPDRRSYAADHWLATAEGMTDSAQRAEIVRAACKVVDDPRFADLFGPDSLAEAPVAAVVEGGLVVAGTADRLLVTDTRVQVVDFKTGRIAPASLDTVPPYHLRQMAAYVAALEVIFPDRAVEAALLYTAGPTLFALPPELIARHKPGFAATEQSFAPAP